MYKKSEVKLKQQLKEKAAIGNGGMDPSSIKDPKKGKKPTTGCCGADGLCNIM